jgi:chemotaxis methyl-accepting protein methylase
VEKLAALLGEFAGLDPPSWALEARVRERAAALGLDGDGYVERALADRDELAHLVEALRVGETRLFRHRKQLDILAERVLPTLRRDGAPIRAWSAGCASGEEAWTLAMLLAERNLPFSLVATDLSPAALARARDGKYPAALVERDVPPALVPKYFRRVGEHFIINDRLRPHVEFQTHNLLGAGYPQGVELVFCRNVLIYFDDDRRSEVVTRLVRALSPGGWLCLGYSETLRDAAELDGIGGAIYCKREKERTRTPPQKAKMPQNASKPPFRVVLREVEKTPLPRLREIPTLVLQGDYHDGARLAAELRPLLSGAADAAIVDLDGASFLGDEAARVLRRASEAAPRLQLRATRAAVRRWLLRHALGQS